MSSSESDDDHILSRLFGVRRGQTRHNRKGHGDGSRLFSYLHVPKKLQRWGDSDSDDDYRTEPSSPSHAQAVSIPPSSPKSGSQPSSPKNNAVAPPPPPPLKKEANPFQAEPVVGSDAPPAPPVKALASPDYEAKYDSPEDDEKDVFEDAREAPPDAPPTAPPMAPPMAAPMEKAATKIVNKMESAGLLGGIRKRGEAQRIAREICVDIVNNAINPLIGKGSLTRAEGVDVKHTMYNAAVKAVKKPEATPEDVFAAIRSGVARLKPASERHLKTPPPLTGADAKAQEALNRLSSRRQALQPDDEWDE